MAVTAGRTRRLNGWNAYDWAVDYKYVAAGWTTDAVTGAAARDALVAITPPVQFPKTGAFMGCLYGNRSGQGYDRMSNWIPAAVAGQVRLTMLSPVVTYYVIPLMKCVDGTIIRGPEVTLTTPPLPGPVISGISVTPTQLAATILWTTNIPADEKIEWGLTTAYTGSAVDANLGLSHTEMAMPLVANTLYHYRITSRRESGESSSTTDATFTTLA